MPKGRSSVKKIKNIDNIDKVIVKHKQMEEISEWVEGKKFKDIQIPFDEVIIIIKNMSNIYGMSADVGAYFKLDDKTGSVIIKQFDTLDSEIMFSATIDEDFFNDNEIKVDYVFKNSLVGAHFQPYLQNLGKILVLMIFDVFQYIVNRKTHIVESATYKPRKTYRRNKNKRRKNKSNKYTYIESKIRKYTISDTPVSSRQNRYTNSWTVRGHWRQYSNGKRVWVRSYTKGEGKKRSSNYKIK